MALALFPAVPVPQYHAHLTRTLSKWSAKIAAVAPSALLPSSRATFSQKGTAKDVKSVPMQVDEALQTDGERLRARIRVKRGKGVRIRWTGVDEEEIQEADGRQQGDDDDDDDDEVFDDTDFYQELLRDVIDARGQDGGRDDWMAAQRQKKAKKSVDTKASKGRKLRYEVHEKIQNFMVPVPLAGGGWHEAQIDELFASLLGRGFESAPPVDGIDGGAPDVVGAVEVSGDMLRGLRVFG
ncbi:apoptosis-antagonizing transcription factor [Amylostereum chailletii]|nr:apoptosis-antagonizing transcription factor [Amylostereum chailletii]